MSSIEFAAPAGAIPIIAVRDASLPDVLSTLGAPAQQWATVNGFSAKPGTWIALPNGNGGIGHVLAGIEDACDPHSFGSLPHALPEGRYALHPEMGERIEPPVALLGWGLAAYRFSRYRASRRAPATLVVVPDAAGLAEAQALLEASVLVRDLVNTPTQDMGPEHLEQAVRVLATRYGAQVRSIVGETLLEENFPAIHAVGRASHRAPRLIELTWGDSSHPQLALVGKGVCFDTGGLDIKPSDGMRNMKKDMGGAAHAIALAGLVMDQRLPLHLRLLVPAVENAIGPDAYRPGEVIATRKGVSVEIDNTDAEGRIVLCDALAYAAEASPDLILDFATLTGAARIALGPDLPALFSNDDTVSAGWIDAGERLRDPVWRMPLWRPYLRYLNSHVADIANAGSRMAGAVTAALYLEKFIPAGQRWAHLDVYAWNDSDRPGRPRGGEAMALRSAFSMLKLRYS
ncbi:leucyl aminopeptidase family protein [Xanthomonadaceae bacterium JHOS43]|nr:leucyl aminopeptidase family protein [Xanthomonadaceae bacterium JHOS43]